MAMSFDELLNLTPCGPIRINVDGKHVYTCEQIDMYGHPDNWDWPIFYYEVVSSLDYERPHRTDWKFEQERWGSVRPIHRYSRVKRFESTLYQLLGFRGKVELADVVYIREVGYDRDPLYIWESLRMILKEKGWQKYYNRIPMIIQMLGVNLKIDVGPNNYMVEEIIKDFQCFSADFERLKPSGRSYFPSLRFIAIRMLETYGAKFEFDIPRVRTKRKLKPLDEMWLNMFNSFQNKKQ